MSTDDFAFIDRYSVAILKLLASDPMKSCYQREVARRAGVSVGKTNQVLKAVTAQELVTREHVGKVDLYRYNLNNPAARYLKVFLNLTELRGPLRKLREDSGTIKVVLFGSCADGTDTKESDIDVFVVTSEKKEATGIVQLAGHSIDRRLSPVIVNPLEFSKLKKDDPAFYEQVSRGITLWQRAEE